MSIESNNWTEFTGTVKLVSFWVITTLLDSTFLALWVAIQWAVDKFVIKPLALSGFDQVIVIIFQIMFAISTLAPVAITIYRNISIMVVRTQRNIRQEISKG